MANRLKPDRAHWVKGYQSKPLFDNAPHVRVTVESIFKPSRNITYSFAAFRRKPMEETETYQDV